MPLEMLEETAGTSRRVEPIGRTRGRLNLGIELSVTKFNVKIKNNWFKKYGISCFFFCSPNKRDATLDLPASLNFHL